MNVSIFDPPIYCEILDDVVLAVSFSINSISPFPPFPNVCSICIIHDFEQNGNGRGMVVEMVIPWKW